MRIHTKDLRDVTRIGFWAVLAAVAGTPLMFTRFYRFALLSAMQGLTLDAYAQNRGIKLVPVDGLDTSLTFNGMAVQWSIDGLDGLEVKNITDPAEAAAVYSGAIQRRAEKLMTALGESDKIGYLAVYMDAQTKATETYADLLLRKSMQSHGAPVQEQVQA